jgi:hypothetical protein
MEFECVSALRMKLIRGSVLHLMSWRHLRKLRCPVLSRDNAPETAVKAVNAAIRAHVWRRCWRIC